MVNVGTKTFSAKKEDISHKWLIVDAKGKTLGRLSSEIAKILRGKGKVIFTPHVDCGDFVIVINAAQVKFTGNKMEDKKYYRHSGYVGNLKTTNLKDTFSKSPRFVLKNAVKGMLPHNTLGRMMLKKLKIYVGETHPHKAQKPEKIEI
jgi:large subunit ribosomal protein L13